MAAGKYSFLRKYSDIVLAIVMVGIVGMMIVPLPTFLLDILLTINISLSVVILLIALYIWIRGTVPRLRTDQLMNLAWKFMLPVALVNIVVAAIWFLLAAAGWGWVPRWGICGAMLIVPYVLFSRAFTAMAAPRVYRYAS